MSASAITPDGANNGPQQGAPATPPKHPRSELLRHYKAVFQAAWQQRYELAGPARLADEAAFLPAALSLQVTPPHPAPRRVYWAVISLFTIAILWACFGKVDIVAVAPGRIVVSEGTKLIQPLEASVVKAIRVQDGDKVKAGQVLIELDPTTAQADNSRVGDERASALSEAWRTKALLEAMGKRKTGKAPPLPAEARLPENGLNANALALTESQLVAEWENIQAQLGKMDADIEVKTADLATVRGQISKLLATLPLLQKREDDFTTLADQGFVSQHANQDRVRDRIEMERDLDTLRSRREATKVEIKQAEQARAAWRADTLRTLNERYAKADLQTRQLQSEGLKTSQRERLTTLTAPVDGTVQQLAIRTTGGVVTPAQVLLVVVPDQAQVTAEVTLENKDVGFIHEGQDASIKLETFTFTRYGTVPATVTTITADAVMQEAKAQPKDGEAVVTGGAVFPATLTLAQNTIMVDGKPIKLAPGMNLTAEIKTGKRRIIEYLLSPVQSHMSESMRER